MMNRLLPGAAFVLALCAAPCCAHGQAVWEPGKSYFGRSNYIEYIAGDLPLIISAPHGGRLAPKEIPNRAKGEFTSDSNTDELAHSVQQAFYSLFGHYPHVIICRLDRRKVDCNRDLVEGAGADPSARRAWNDYHRFIAIARSNVLAHTAAGFYVDLHGQSHAIQRIELGYGLTPRQLTNADRVLNQPGYADANTIGGLVQRTGVPFAELLRGTNSLGSLLAAKGFPTVPSAAMPDPGPSNAYFDGGYNVRRHGSVNGGAIDGVQMEMNYVGVRDTERNRARFALAFAQAFDTFFARYYSFDLRTCAVSDSKRPTQPREAQ